MAGEKTSNRLVIYSLATRKTQHISLNARLQYVAGGGLDTLPVLWGEPGLAIFHGYEESVGRFTCTMRQG